VNNNGKIGLDDIGMKTGPGSEKMKLTRLVEPSGSGTKVALRSKSFRSAYERRSNSKKISMLLVCAAAIIIASAVAVAAFGIGAQPKVKAGVGDNPPPFPFYVAGYTTTASFVHVPNCVVTITDVTTGAVNTTVSDSTGFYFKDIQTGNPAINVGDVISVTAHDSTMTGTNQTTYAGGPLYINIWVALNTPIPEFTDIVIPIVGMVSIFAVARVASNRSKDE